MKVFPPALVYQVQAVKQVAIQVEPESAEDVSASYRQMLMVDQPLMAEEEVEEADLELLWVFVLIPLTFETTFL